MMIWRIDWTVRVYEICVYVGGRGKSIGSVHYADFIKQANNILRNTQLTFLLTMFDLAGISPSWWNGIKNRCPKQLNEVEKFTNKIN